MKKISTLVLALIIALPVFSQGRGKIDIPDLKGFVTLKCDFHMHTMFSDGTVWPTVRVDEAYRDGLDAIAITDHLESRRYLQDVEKIVKSSLQALTHNIAYELASPVAQTRNIILIRGSEITRSMPPGHSNAVFITDADALANNPDYKDAFRAAKAQNAFIFWNHPGWESQQPDTTLWWPEHTQLLEQGFLHGIEVVNGPYYPEAHRWCLEKKLTMIGNTDVHAPMAPFAPGKHRTMTLVFARNKTAEAIYEALKERRTAVYFDRFVIGEEIYLKELFENAVEITVTKAENLARITFANKSDLTFYFKRTAHDARLTYFRNNALDPYILNPQSAQTITVRLNQGITGGNVNFCVENFLVQPSQGMNYTVKIE